MSVLEGSYLHLGSMQSGVCAARGVMSHYQAANEPDTLRRRPTMAGPYATSLPSGCIPLEHSGRRVKHSLARLRNVGSGTAFGWLGTHRPLQHNPSVAKGLETFNKLLQSRHSHCMGFQDEISVKCMPDSRTSCRHSQITQELQVGWMWPCCASSLGPSGSRSCIPVEPQRP
jgi:hypothetical protein